MNKTDAPPSANQKFIDAMKAVVVDMLGEEADVFSIDIGVKSQDGIFNLGWKRNDPP